MSKIFLSFLMLGFSFPSVAQSARGLQNGVEVIGVIQKSYDPENFDGIVLLKNSANKTLFVKPNEPIEGYENCVIAKTDGKSVTASCRGEEIDLKWREMTVAERDKHFRSRSPAARYGRVDSYFRNSRPRSDVNALRPMNPPSPPPPVPSNRKNNRYAPKPVPEGAELDFENVPMEQPRSRRPARGSRAPLPPPPPIAD